MSSAAKFILIPRGYDPPQGYTEYPLQPNAAELRWFVGEGDFIDEIMLPLSPLCYVARLVSSVGESNE